MSNIPSFTPKELIKIIEKLGFKLLRQKGSHQIFYNEVSKRKVVIPMHNKDIPKGTFNEILKQAGIEKKDLI
ncbi:MAG TPA: type II toxin-antitoxin system HicA family toxin [Ignavibacteria bacterium]|nr:type II toxin-antitoxin system HicA family toxin [Ignavibacteria bacterium]